LIRVPCATCGEVFEIGEEFAGLTEFCPFCGAHNDIPNLEEEPEPETVESIPELETPMVSISAITPVPQRERGIPSALWWTLLVGAIAGFIVGCVYLFSDNWESRHVQALSEAANRGDAKMVDEDYAGAAVEYGSVIQTVGQRQIESGFIRQLVERSQRGELEAQIHLRAAATTLPTTAPATQPTIDFHQAIVAFQRDSEAFPRFVRARPLPFQDSNGNWRRRQFVVWEVTYEQQPQSDPPRILLKYSCASGFTEPHDQLKQANDDDDFVNDESPQVVHCQTLFEWSTDHWIVIRHDIESPSDTTPGLQARPSLDDLYDLERRAFSAANHN